MTDESQLRGADLLRAASGLPQGEREAFLNAQRAEDPDAVEYALRGLREQSGDSGDLFGGIGCAFELPENLKERELGSTISGDWRLQEKIGAGGYGRVYRVVRTTGQIRQEGALKFLDLRPKEVDRFQRERQLLANLNHPGIPRFIDAGTEKSIPFVVMEYVSGMHITDYCDVQGLDISQRIDLFIELCHIMEYAHSTILHRDLKPDNIMVTAGGAVRVLDLGLAAILDPADAGRALTVTGTFLGTYHYVSPEQAQCLPLFATTDVYSLGAVLYRLITGHVPLELERVDWERQLLQEDPLPPSQMLRFRTVPLRDSGTSETLQSPIVVKGATQARLRKQCRGDLDKVILKALKKSPKDRYQSVEELRQDLERFQQEVPVAAHPIGAFERVRRWSGAHWVQACLLAASSVVMMLSMPFSVLHYVEYNAREIDRDHAVQRLRNLAEIGFRHIEVSLPAGADSAEARVAFAQIEREMLRGIETLPQQTKRQLDRTFIISSLDLAVQWRELGEFGKALETLSPAIERANYRYLAEPRIGIWREVYARLLEERIGLNSQFGRDEQSAEDVRALVLLQRSGRRGAKE